MKNIRLGEVEQAVEQIRNPEDVIAWMPIVQQFIDTQPAVAAKILSRMNEVRPNDAIVLYNLALAVDRMERYDRAIELYRQTLAIDPGDMEARNNIAIVYRKQKKYRKAEEQYREIMRRKPDHYFAYCNYANMLVDEGKFQDAEIMYRKALELSPSYSDAHRNYAQLLEKMGRGVEATEHYKKFMKYDHASRKTFNRRKTILLLISLVITCAILYSLHVPLIWGLIAFVPAAVIVYAFVMLIVVMLRTVFTASKK